MKKLYRAEVFSAKGKRIGRVSDVLVAPGSKRVVGYVVERPRLGMLLDRKDRYLAFDRATLNDRDLMVSAQSGQWDGAAGKRLGVNWDETVIWMGMPVRTRSGTRLGTVRDGAFDATTGELSVIGLTGGITADVAVGVRDVPASQVVGFETDAIVVEDPVATIETDGGVAAAAGKGAAVAKKGATEAAKTAVIYGKAAARVAGQSETGKKAMGFLKSLKDQVVDAMGEPEDEQKK